VKRFGKYGRKASLIVNRFGKYGRRVALPRHFIFIITLFISIITFLTKVCHHFIFQIFPLFN
jgi:hypothetical protein